MLLTFGIVLLIIWLICVIAFHVTVWLIHLLIIVGVALLIWHFVRGRRNRVE